MNQMNNLNDLFMIHYSRMEICFSLNNDFLTQAIVWLQKMNMFEYISLMDHLYGAFLSFLKIKSSSPHSL